MKEQELHLVEKANGRDSGAAQLNGNYATDYLDVTYNIKDNSILNADVNSAAAIAQSKLNMQALTQEQTQVLHKIRISGI